MTIYYPPPNEMTDEAGNVAIEVTGDGTNSDPTTIKIRGDLDIIGELTAVQTTTIDDNNIVLNAVDTPSDTNADGGGLTIKGSTDKTIAWTNSSDAWHFNQGINITSGRLGVGTTSPTQPLHVKGSNAYVKLETDAGGEVWTCGVSGGEDKFIIRDDTGNDTRLVIDNAGNVGIGTTSPATALDVAGVVSATGTSASAPAYTFSGDADTGIYRPSADTIRFTTGGSHAATIDSSGNVGIGTTSPTYSLDVVPGSASALRIKGSTNGVDVNCAIENAGTSATDDTLLSLTTQGGAGDAALRFAIAGNETWSMGIDNSDGDKLKISQSSTLHTDTRLTLQGNKVGIGTDSPATTLDVSGTFKVSGATTLNGIAYTWPSSDGTAGYQLSTDGNGALSWTAQGSGGGSGMTSFTLSDGSNTSAITDGNTLTVSGGVGISTSVGTDTVTVTLAYDIETETLSSSDVTSTTVASLYLVNASTSGRSFTVPSASSFGAGAQVLVKNTNSSNSMTLKTSGGTIDGTAAGTGVSLPALASITLVSDASNFHVL